MANMDAPLASSSQPYRDGLPDDWVTGQLALK
jgi:hypothetical protein